MREVCSVLVKAAVRREVIHDQLQKFLSNCHVVQCHIQYLCDIKKYVLAHCNIGLAFLPYLGKEFCRASLNVINKVCMT